jgi:protein-tyrosine phosphatase
VFERILVVCVGNICRSPTVEYLLRHRLGDRRTSVSSAGLGALEGQPIDPLAGELLAEHGIDASAHRARQLDDRDLTAADLILVMQRAHLATLAKRSPYAVGRTFLLGKWQDDREVPDPYHQQRPAFEHVYRLIDEGVDGWLRRLQQPAFLPKYS